MTTETGRAGGIKLIRSHQFYQPFHYIPECIIMKLTTTNDPSIGGSVGRLKSSNSLRLI